MSGKEKSAFTRAVTWCAQHGFDMVMRALGPVMSAAATSLILLVVYTYFKLLLPSIVAESSAAYAVGATVVGLFLLFNILFNYIAAALTSPGRPPLGQEYPAPHVMAALVNDPDLKHNDGKTHRFCNTCKAAKPMRTHHCSVCKRCTVRW